MINMSQNFTKILGFVALSALGTFAEAQTNINWAPAGPVYTAGRARNMIVDNTDPSRTRLYVGSASSGIFKSTDGGSNWAPINDQGSVRNISYLAQAKDGTIYAGTGEGFLRWGQKAKAEPGSGLYKLTGSSLTDLTQVVSAAVVGTVINRVACDPSNSQHIALATNKGIWVSLDGTNFTQASIPTSSLASGQDVKFDNNGILYCSIGSELAYLTYNTVPSKVYKSTDNSLSAFTAITPTSSSLSDSNYGRIELAIAPSNNNVIYASCANKSIANPTTEVQGASGSASLKAIFVSYDAGSSWAVLLQGSAQIDPLTNGSTIASGDYSHVLVVNPVDPNMLFVGGYSFYIYFRTGGTNANPIGSWVQVGSSFAKNSPYYLHENIHDIKIITGSPEKFYFITDAGIYRSLNLSQSSNTHLPSFQPFYKGLTTGQFNSVSMERYPITAEAVSSTPGTSVTPYVGYIGGTGGNGLTYYSGTFSLVTQETNYIGGEIYNAEYSKILSDAAFMTSGSGKLYRTSNAKTTNPALLQVNGYSGVLSKIAPSASSFNNYGYSTGTPFKLWENYGQRTFSPDSIPFYNDSLRIPYTPSSVSQLTTQSTFVFAVPRPNKNRYAMIDSIVIRTATVTLPIEPAPVPPAFTGSDIKDLTLKLNNNYVNSGSVTVISGSSITTTGLVSSTTNPSVTLNNTTLLDEISVTFSSPPFLTKTVTSLPNVPNPADLYRVYATVFYKYKANDSISLTDNNISTRTMTYKGVLPKALSWAYGSRPAYIISGATNSSVANPTYVLNPGNITQTTSSQFTVTPVGPTNYTSIVLGSYTYSAIPVIHTLTAITNTNVTGSTYTFALLPGTETKTALATTTLVTFTVEPVATTIYTITQTGTGTLTSETSYTIGASSYELYPGGITQASPVFVVTPTTATTYTLLGISSDTVTGANTSKTAGQTTATHNNIGSTVVSFPKNNPLVKLPQAISSRLAIALNNSGNTGGKYAIVVSKNSLNLNDPLNLVRISQSGCWTDDASGNPTTNTISIPGVPTIIEWSKSGTELYYATNDNKLYRVSHITTIMDQSSSSYSGKFFTDVFKYNISSVNDATLNPMSPYRTTLIGDFGTKQISSISVSNDNKNLVVTFNAAGSGTLVAYNTNDASKSDLTNIGWVNKSTGLPTEVTTYCSMMEKGNSKKVFIGTNSGVYYTSDITSGNWVNVNTLASNDQSKLPNVQVFDIEQQTYDPWDCYNSGQIYIATNGRGVWVTGAYFVPYIVSVEEMDKKEDAKYLSVYPNPSNGNVTVSFSGINGEKASVEIMDISGRIVKNESLGVLEAGDVKHTFETASLNSGVYILNIQSDSGIRRVTKLIVAK
jgi:hypothetical protein